MEPPILRPYQKECVSKILWAKNANLEGNDLVVLPTGAGKSLVIAAIAQALPEPILILQPSKEILEQNYRKLCNVIDPFKIGIYSASMNQKNVGHITLATIQSIYTKPEFFSHFKLVIIDECHLVNPKNLNGMFSSFLKAIGNPKIIGLTATPYRMDTMYLSRGFGEFEARATIKLINRTKAFFWNRLLYVMNIGDLISQGYLCPLEYMDASVVKHEELKLNKGQTDFDLDALDIKLTTRQNEILDVISSTQNISKSVLVFCSSVSQAEKYAACMPGSAFVTGKTPKKEREFIINQFKDGEIKTVFNVGVLTTGFDHPTLDAIVLLRPTRSIALYYQMLGRGVRIAPGKKSCRVVDLTSTVASLGRLETIRLEKQDKWELISETGSWHNRELYRFTFTK